MTTLFLLASLLLTAAQQAPKVVDGIEHFRVKSELLSAFQGKQVFLEAGVVVPDDLEPGDPVCFIIHGLGGSHRGTWTQGAQLLQWMSSADYPRMLYVYLNANSDLGHTYLADSLNNGPYARALVEEFVPSLESFFEVGGEPDSRFLTGHSSGGWSALWLQVTYPKFFGGAWGTAPDPVDFRDFSGINLYEFENAFVDPNGKEIQLVRQGGKFVMTARQASAMDGYEAQVRGVEAVFSPPGAGGQPMQLFDLKTGAIDHAVVKAWTQYDLRRKLERLAPDARAALVGKLHVFVGDQDDDRLEGAVRLFGETLTTLKLNATVVIAPGRGHANLLDPHAELWPRALLTRIHREMRHVFDGR